MDNPIRRAAGFAALLAAPALIAMCASGLTKADTLVTPSAGQIAAYSAYSSTR